MRVDEFLVDFLISKGVTDAFGIPGGVILDFLYAMDRRKDELTPHLCYHEQGAAFAALGYAQTKQSLGVAYATRGPGITNMVTAIADAYYDSVPLMVVTAHAVKKQNMSMRIEYDQELDILPMMQGITKYVTRIDSVDELDQKLSLAYAYAMEGRKGPVVIDILSSLFSKEMAGSTWIATTQEEDIARSTAETAVEQILSELRKAKRPLILIGDGVKQAGVAALTHTVLEKMNIPVISSRAAHDVVSDLSCYYGFVGSHGIRCANFLIAHADMLLCLGNRMSFPVESESFGPVFTQKRTVRVDIDRAEFMRAVPNSMCIQIDLQELIPQLSRSDFSDLNCSKWAECCSEIRNCLWNVDQKEHIQRLMRCLLQDTYSAVVTCDVGNHEFWVSHAAVYAKVAKQFLYSKSFGALGCSIPKAIGAYYASKKPVLCITGDQGMQMNIQELQYISVHRMPIHILVINNHASGMIRSRELDKGMPYLLHTTKNSGYGVPDLVQLAHMYGFAYQRLDTNGGNMNPVMSVPSLNEFSVEETIGLDPSLPRGNKCWNLRPGLKPELMDRLQKILQSE